MIPSGVRTVLVRDAIGTRKDISAIVQRDLNAHRDVLQGYHELYYNAPYTWALTTFCGVSVMKATTDLWIYQELITSYRPRTIIETGTAYGGSALWFAFIADALDLDTKIITIDIEDHGIKIKHPRVDYRIADCLDPNLIADLQANLEAPVLISLDSEHLEEHVYEELRLYAPLLDIGDWMVVEDTNVSWPGMDNGARGGLERYLSEHRDEWAQDLVCERYLLTMHPGGWLQRVRRCEHGEASS